MIKDDQRAWLDKEFKNLSGGTFEIKLLINAVASAVAVLSVEMQQDSNGTTRCIIIGKGEI